MSPRRAATGRSPSTWMLPSSHARPGCNFTPVARTGYRVGVPRPGYYREIRAR